MFAGPLGRSTFTPPKSSFDSPLYGLVSLRRSHIICWQIREIDRVLSEAGSDADDLNFELLSHISCRLNRSTQHPY